jgi:hypothetical protein
VDNADRDSPVQSRFPNMAQDYLARRCGKGLRRSLFAATFGAAGCPVPSSFHPFELLHNSWRFNTARSSVALKSRGLASTQW